ncbi:MAG: gamma-glutamyltransferase [Acidobacteria bacterium]|nr:gamma-glutamyltransferase [Acidobacteriota bacterium]
MAIANPRAPVFGKRGMVVSGHPTASLAGWKILEAGGSVVDAAVASAAVLAVVLPQSCTLGGDAFMLIYDGVQRTTVGLNASGPAPATCTVETFASGIPQTGPLSVTVPGVVAGWDAAHQRLGRLAWQEVLAPAISAAEQGFPVSRGLTAAIAQQRALLEADPAMAALFLPGGRTLAAGQILRQPALAATLREIAASGSQAFYSGRPATSLSLACQSRGGLLHSSDFHNYRPEWTEPLATRYRHVTVRTMPPNSFGLLLLLQLNVLEGFNLAGLSKDPATRLALLIGAARAAFGKGRRAIADPAFGQLPIAEILGPQATERLRAAARKAIVEIAEANRGGTALVSVADNVGNGVVLIQSIFHLFGSGVLDAETGVILNNRMTGFTTEAGHPNQVAPRKRPAHTLSPAMVFHEGHLRFLLGTPGGPGQTVTLTQVLTNLVDLGMDLEQAVETPRWSLDLAGKALVEHGIDDPVLARLHALGYQVERGPAGSLFFGSAEAIALLPGGVLCGAADGRREACVVGT